MHAPIAKNEEKPEVICEIGCCLSYEYGSAKVANASMSFKGADMFEACKNARNFLQGVDKLHTSSSNPRFYIRGYIQREGGAEGNSFYSAITFDTFLNLTGLDKK